MWYVCISLLFLSVLHTCRIHACLHVCWYTSVFRLTCLCVYVDGDWRLMSSVFSSYILYIVSVLYIVAGSLTKSQSLQFWGSLANQTCFRDFLSPPTHARVAGRWLCVHGFYRASGVMNSGPDAFVINILSAESSSRLIFS